MSDRWDAWKDSYDEWKLRSPYDEFPYGDEPEEEDDPLAELYALHADPLCDEDAFDIFDFWESEATP